jgi:hypothetical protein
MTLLPLLISLAAVGQPRVADELPVNVFQGPESARYCWTPDDFAAVTLSRKRAQHVFENAEQPATKAAAAVLKDADILPLPQNRPASQLGGVAGKREILLRRNVAKYSWLSAIIALHEAEHIAHDLESGGQDLMDLVRLFQGESRCYSNDRWRIGRLFEYFEDIRCKRPEEAEQLPSSAELQMLIDYFEEAELVALDYKLRLEALWLTGSWFRYRCILVWRENRTQEDLHRSQLNEAMTEQQRLEEIGMRLRVGLGISEVDGLEKSVTLLRQRLIDELGDAAPAEVLEHIEETLRLSDVFRTRCKELRRIHQPQRRIAMP